MKSACSLAIVVVGLALSAMPAAATTLTFEDLALGTVLSNQYAALGVTFTANAFVGRDGPTGSWATNTSMAIGSVSGGLLGKLGTAPSPVSGNILHSYSGWQTEDGDPSFMITFAGVATGFSAGFAGVSLPSHVQLFAYDGDTLVATLAGTTTGQFTLSYAGPVTRVAITPGSFFDWVGVDNITYTLAAVPEASTTAMWGAGLVALLALRRRKTA